MLDSLSELRALNLLSEMACVILTVSFLRVTLVNSQCRTDPYPWVDQAEWAMMIFPLGSIIKLLSYIGSICNLEIFIWVFFLILGIFLSLFKAL